MRVDLLALLRPNMRFVAVKTIDQQALLALHRARQEFVKARTATLTRLGSALARDARDDARALSLP